MTHIHALVLENGVVLAGLNEPVPEKVLRLIARKMMGKLEGKEGLSGYIEALDEKNITVRFPNNLNFKVTMSTTQVVNVGSTEGISEACFH